MQIFKRDNVHSHCVGAEWPDFLGLDIRNCAIYGLGNYVQKEGKTDQPDRDIAVVACLSKGVFVE
jgi:hypothetical protein